MKRPSSIGSMFLAVAAVTALSACADDAGSAEREARIDEADVSEPAALQQSGSVPLKDPAGVTFGSVQAAGGGCPKGTWDADISSDGKVFTMTFSKFELTSSPKTPSNITTDCTIVLTLNTPSGISYAVADLTYQGYAFLTEGMTAIQRSYYAYGGLGGSVSVGGSTIPLTEHTLTGPFDKSYQFVDNVATSNLNWSECGRQRNLQVRTNLQIRNPNRTGDGYISLSDLNGSLESKLVLRFARKDC